MSPLITSSKSLFARSAWSGISPSKCLRMTFVSTRAALLAMLVDRPTLSRNTVPDFFPRGVRTSHVFYILLEDARRAVHEILWTDDDDSAIMLLEKDGVAFLDVELLPDANRDRDLPLAGDPR